AGQGRGALARARRPHGPARGARHCRRGGHGVPRDMSLMRGSAFVTGGGSGIGRAIAEALAARGAPVAVFDLLPDGGKETLGAIEARGGRACFLQGDASRWGDVDAGVTGAVATLGPLGIMVNAAGILDGYAPADELTLPVWERVIGINLTGTFVGCKRALVEMLPRAAGRIVNIASVAGVVGSGGGPAYVASKHGVVGLTRQLAVAYAARGVTVNAICPGAIATGLRANSTRILGRDAPEMRGIGGDDAAVRASTPADARRYSNERFAEAFWTARDIAQTMDELGYYAMWTAEHHFQREGYEVLPNLIQLSLWLATQTKRLKFGCAFNILPMWHPLRLAEDYAMADIVTGGRVIMGVGRGYHTREVESFGAPL